MKIIPFNDTNLSVLVQTYKHIIIIYTRRADKLELEHQILFLQNKTTPAWGGMKFFYLLTYTRQNFLMSKDKVFSGTTTNFSKGIFYAIL